MSDRMTLKEVASLCVRPWGSVWAWVTCGVQIGAVTVRLRSEGDATNATVARDDLHKFLKVCDLARHLERAAK
jgi:aspartyl aminopeptidase